MGNGNGTRKRWLVSTAIALVGAAAVVLGSVWALSADRAGETKDVETNTRAIADHENRLRSMETQITEIRTDVRWIRQTMEDSR